MGLVYSYIGAARVPVAQTICGNCSQIIYVPLAHIARCDGVMICPNCGDHEVLCASRIHTIARILQDYRE